jgi:DNA-binding XRE family transcriptional regulator
MAMNKQVITTPGGERLVLVPEAEFDALVDKAEDSRAAAAHEEFRRKLAAGEEELLPADMVKRLIEGEHPVRVWRTHRGLSGKALATAAGIAAGYLSQIEKGQRDGTLDTYRKLAAALRVAIDDLA